MSDTKLHYSYVSSKHPIMVIAYYMAKGLYEIHEWNLKTTPIAIVVDKKGRVVVSGICADGAHPKLATCDRLKKKGTPYNTCTHCSQEEHAEIKAIQKLSDDEIRRAKDFKLYLYGHYKICENCQQELLKIGLTKIVLLENAEILFDRHNPGTVLGKKTQFLE
jgi:deoxycytidylate deaminase